ncbi:hypothetical protein NKR19_g7486 [Coniochaeta hoffmannii]|uniref:Uncharacterized protein n=1 Tax=Coniochaeta hoffmannii TaxID=91930 RepID=A0AA38RA88_9PEZI|nr:hypothetical protein NKR19_g7486 [Coniochaeta hoffmannii]
MGFKDSRTPSQQSKPTGHRQRALFARTSLQQLEVKPRQAVEYSTVPSCWPGSHDWMLTSSIHARMRDRENPDSQTRDSIQSWILWPEAWAHTGCSLKQ